MQGGGVSAISRKCEGVGVLDLDLGWLGTIYRQKTCGRNMELCFTYSK